MIIHGEPELLCRLPMPDLYGTYVLYMPVKFPDSLVRIPTSLGFLLEIIDICRSHERKDFQYIYLSYECSFTKKGKSQKRPGWHADGFLTDDVNFIWHSTCPTIFNGTKFNIEPDHKISMEQFEAQADESLNYTLPNRSLIRLDSTVVHRADVAQQDEVRTFIKVSFSNEKYNLKGNTHNPFFDYEWEMFDRALVRNHPIIKEADFVKGSL